MEYSSTHLLVGWIAILFGVVSGSVIGLFFHREDWSGGYHSFRRRLLRLGHISFFGFGFINILYALSLPHLEGPATFQPWVSWSLILGLITMPLCCYLTAWRDWFRFFFPVPVVSVLTGLILLLVSWGT
jgi:hypothetical protein